MNRAAERCYFSTRLAVGDAGLVYKATERATGRAVVLKLLLPVEEISHPLDVDGLLRDAADIAAQLPGAVYSGELYQYPHGDLKPSDITMGRSPDGRPIVKVLDWGLANYRKEPNPAALPYTAPGRLAGAPPSHAADHFSAGAVLHYPFSGQQPVEAATKEEFAAAWSALSPLTLRSLRPDIPAALVTGIAPLLQPGPAMHPPSAAAALTEPAALNLRPPSLLPAGISHRPPRPQTQPVRRAVVQRRSLAGSPQHAPVRVPKKKRSSAVFFTCLLLLVTLGAGGFVYWNTTQAGRTPGFADARASLVPPPLETADPAVPSESPAKPAPPSATVATAAAAPVSPRLPAAASEPGRVASAVTDAVRATFSSSPAPPVVNEADIANLTARTGTE